MTGSSSDGPTLEALESLLSFLGSRSTDPATGYQRLRSRLVKILEIRAYEYRLRTPPEDLADEAIGRVAGQLADGLVIQAKDPFKYFYGVARRVVQEAARKEQREGGGPLRDDVPAMVTPEAEHDEKEASHRCLDECLAALAPAERELILEFYRVDRGQRRIAHRKGLAGRLGMTANALRIKAYRIRHKRLAPCVAECLKPAAGSREK